MKTRASRIFFAAVVAIFRSPAPRATARVQHHERGARLGCRWNSTPAHVRPARVDAPRRRSSGNQAVMTGVRILGARDCLRGPLANARLLAGNFVARALHFQMRRHVQLIRVAAVEHSWCPVTSGQWLLRALSPGHPGAVMRCFPVVFFSDVQCSHARPGGRCAC